MARFRVFGPVEVEAGGTALDLGPPKQRAVLAALLMDVGHPVSIDTLVDRVWADEPPLQPRNALYGHIMRIRRLLIEVRRAGDDDSPLELTRQANGYVLHIDPDQVDTHQFGRLVAKATDPSLHDVRRAELLRAALDLWRDPPLADLAGPWVSRVRQGLVQQRLNAFLAWARTELRLGRPDEVITHAHPMIADHPLVEPLAALMMRALHGAGRTAEALGRYETTRTRLADELGVDPSPELRELHLAILRGDEVVEGKAGAGASQTTTGMRTETRTEAEIETATGSEAESRRPGSTGPSPRHASNAGAPDTGESRTRNDAVPAVTRPAQLPPELVTQVGRQREIQDLLSFAGHTGDLTGDLTGARAAGRPGKPPGTVVISAIDGMAGVGKTTLAVHLAHRLAGNYPDGQLFLDLHGFTQNVPPTAPAMALDRLLRAIGVPGEQIPQDVDERAALWRTRMAGRRYLILLDNAAHEDQVRPLLCASPASLTLVTSRRRLSGLDNARLVSLDVLSEPEAISLFRGLAGPDRGDEVQIAEVVERCGCLPLAVRLLATRLRTRPAWTVGDLLHRLGDPGRRLTELGSGERGVAAAFGLSYDQLDAEQRRLFRLLGLFPGADFDAYAASALANVGVDKVEAALEAMVDAHLLASRAYGRYHLHDLLRVHAADVAERTEPEAERTAALRRLLEYYLATASDAIRLYIPAHPLTPAAVPGNDTPLPSFADREQAGRWLNTERGNLVAMAECAAERRWPEPLEALSSCLFRYFSDGAHHGEALAVHTALLDTARAAADRLGEARALWRLGETHYRLNHHDLALTYLDHALALLSAERPDEQIDVAYALYARGSLLEDIGRFADARDCLAEVAELQRVLGDQAGEARLLCAVSELDRLFGRFEVAESHARRALALATGAGDRPAEAAAYRFLGSACLGLERYEEALGHFRNSLRRYEEVGSRPRECLVLVGIGHGLRGLGRLDEAVDRYRQALDLACGIENRNSEFEARHGLGGALVERGQPEAALDQLGRALHLAGELGQEHDQARAHQALGHAHRALGNAEPADEHHRAAESVYARLGVPPAPE